MDTDNVILDLCAKVIMVYDTLAQIDPFKTKWEQNQIKFN